MFAITFATSDWLEIFHVGEGVLFETGHVTNLIGKEVSKPTDFLSPIVSTMVLECKSNKRSAKELREVCFLQK